MVLIGRLCEFRVPRVINYCNVFCSVKFVYLSFIFCFYCFVDFEPCFEFWHIIHVLSECLLVLLASFNSRVVFLTTLVISARDGVNSYHMFCVYIFYCFLVLDGFFHFFTGG